MKWLSFWRSNVRVLLLACLISQQGFGGGFEGPGIGTRALSMGGAFVGLADDWSAAFWNPAGLAFQEGWGVGQAVDVLWIRSFDGNSIANPLPPFTRDNINQRDPFFQLGGEPSQFNVTDTTLHAVLPSLVGYKRWKEWAFTAGIFSPMGYAFDWEDHTVPGIQASYDSKGYIVDYNVSVAREWNHRWALGVGMNWLDARVQRNASKQTSTYAFTSSSDGRGQALQGVVGALGRFTESFSLGFTYKTSAAIDMQGTANLGDTRFPLTIPGVGTFNNEVSPIETELLNPPAYSAGMAFRPTPSLTLTADWQGTDWRETRTKATFERPGLFMQNQDFDAGWRFTHRARVGGEYRWTYQPQKQIVTHWGYMWDPAAVPDNAVSLTNLVDVNRNYYSLGIGWRIKSWEPTLGYSYEIGSRTIGGVSYKSIARLLMVGIQWRS